MATDNRYNGYTNQETWAVALWLHNDEGLYGYWRDVAHECEPDDASAELTERLRDEFTEHPLCTRASLYSDLLTTALGKVNWEEVADSILDD